MKLLIDARTLGSKPSGVGMYAYNFIQGILADGRHQVAIVTDVAESSEMKELIGRGVPVHTFGRPAAKTIVVLSYFRFVQRLIKRMKPDIFWEPNNLFPTALQNPGGKIVVTVQDLFPFTMPECYRPWYPLYFKHGIQNILKHADGLVYTSDCTRERMEELFPEATRMPNANCRIIVNPPKDVPMTHGEYFFYVGNLERRKGTDLLIRAYTRYIDEGGNRPLYLAGKVREKDIQDMLEDALGRYPMMKYLGYISAAKRQEHYSNCFGLVFPSRAEGFGMPVIEALCYGKGVLTSDLPIFRETVGDVAQTFILDKDDKKSAERLSEAMFAMHPVSRDLAEDAVNRYNEQDLTEELLKFFEQMIGE